MNPLRVRALAILLQAQRDAALGRQNAQAWLESRLVADICDALGVSQAALLRRTAARRVGKRTHYVGT